MIENRAVLKTDAPQKKNLLRQTANHRVMS